MKILSIIKGFVTNSSSANYWLDSPEPEANTPPGYIDYRYIPNLNKTVEGAFESLLIWVFFSLIIILIFLGKKAKKVQSNLTLWLKTFGFSLLIFILGSLYLIAQTKGYYSVYLINKILTLDAMVLIGLSFALSKLAYFWKFFESKLIYRKYLGLTGFGFALLHPIISIFFIPQRFDWPDWFIKRPIEIMFSSLALGIFALMAIISIRYIANKLKEKNRRFLLRLGFIGYIFATIHLILLKYNIWISWFKTRDIFLPPFSLITITFALSVIIIHLVYWFKLKKSKKAK